VKKKMGRPSLLPLLFLFSLFFLSGILIGQGVVGNLPSSSILELSNYLEDFALLDSDVTFRTIISTVVLYFRYPLIAFLLGYASIGIVLLPLTTVFFGFFMSFSVCCFAAAFGFDGVILALAVSGLRCAITLPCYFLLAIPAWGNSVALARFSFGREHRTSNVIYGRDWWKRLIRCAVILIAGVCLELLISSYFLQMALNNIFT